MGMTTAKSLRNSLRRIPNLFHYWPINLLERWSRDPDLNRRPVDCSIYIMLLVLSLFSVISHEAPREEFHFPVCFELWRSTRRCPRSSAGEIRPPATPRRHTVTDDSTRRPANTLAELAASLAAARPRNRRLQNDWHPRAPYPESQWKMKSPTRNS